MVTRYGPQRHRRRESEDPHWKQFFSEETAEQREEARRQETLDLSLADIGLSARNVNTLEESGICFVRDLARLSREDLLSIENVGERTLTECKEAMKHLKISHPNWNRRARRKKVKRKKARRSRPSPGPRPGGV